MIISENLIAKSRKDQDNNNLDQEGTFESQPLGTLDRGDYESLLNSHIDQGCQELTWDEFDFDAMVYGGLPQSIEDEKEPCGHDMNDQDDIAKAGIDTAQASCGILMRPGDPSLFPEDANSSPHRVNPMSPSNFTVGIYSAAAATAATITTTTTPPLAFTQPPDVFKQAISTKAEIPRSTPSTTNHVEPLSDRDSMQMALSTSNAKFVSPLLNSHRRSRSMPPTNASFEPRRQKSKTEIFPPQGQYRDGCQAINPMVFHRTPGERVTTRHMQKASLGTIFQQPHPLTPMADYLAQWKPPVTEPDSPAAMGIGGTMDQYRGTQGSPLHGLDPSPVWKEGEARGGKKLDGRALRRVHKTVRKQRLTLATTGNPSEKKLFWAELLDDLEYLRELAYKGIESLGIEIDTEVESMRASQRTSNELVQSLDEPLQVLAGVLNSRTAIPSTGRAIRELDGNGIESLLKAYGIPYASEMFVFEKKSLYLRYVGMGKGLMHQILD